MKQLPAWSLVQASVALGVGLALVACSGAPPAQQAGDGDEVLPDVDGNGDEVDTGASEEDANDGGDAVEDGGDDDDDGPKFDVGYPDSVETGGEERCKVDFLFEIDNSVSMSGEQEAFIAAFPGFMAAFRTTLAAGTDTQVMVVDTDAWGRCSTTNGWVGQSPNQIHQSHRFQRVRSRAGCRGGASRWRGFEQSSLLILR
jgi:hypothetical protein